MMCIAMLILLDRHLLLRRKVMEYSLSIRLSSECDGQTENGYRMAVTQLDVAHDPW